MNKRQNSNSKREHILRSAAKVLAVSGATQLTLEAVAQEAGVSKGGLLYHFTNKEALIEGMVEHFLSDFEEQVDELLETMPDEVKVGRWLWAFVVASFEDEAVEPSMVYATLAATANHPELIHKIRGRYELWKEKATAEGINPTTVNLVISSTDGIWYMRALGIHVLDSERLRALRDYLFELIQANR